MDINSIPDDIIEYIASKLDYNDFIKFILINKRIFNQLKSQIQVYYSIALHPEHKSGNIVYIPYKQYKVTYKDETILYASCDKHERMRIRLKNKVLDGISYQHIHSHSHSTKVGTYYYIYNNGQLHRNVMLWYGNIEVSIDIYRFKILTNDYKSIIKYSKTYRQLIDYLDTNNIQYNIKINVVLEPIDYKLKYFGIGISDTTP